ncbi:hypothetical protein J2736_006306 [Paenibacillus qinlingensis]|uniref:Uncharacterized protein n=1 Tax=Paenibacillus qinlingensis TaxID=1837343 RepID=A0ABU1P7M2_9BACL|nr:hypothetical protein [Paenibacillus qinlingensis]
MGQLPKLTVMNDYDKWETLVKNEAAIVKKLGLAGRGSGC